MSDERILEVRGLDVRFRVGDGVVHAVKGIDFDVHANETVAIVGESGSGKSQTVMSIMGLLASNGEARGSARYRGEELIGLSPRRLNAYRGRKLAMIFQEPMTSLDPLFRIGDQVASVVRHHQKIGKSAARARALELLKLVRIPDAARRIDAYPHEMSGGQRQRVMIAMALANEPDILIADEPTTALDVTIQAEILALIADLQRRLKMAVIFITHDLGIVRRFTHRVYVMKSGEVVESGDTERVFSAPQHAYTKMLLGAEPTGRKEPPPSYAPIVLDAANVNVVFRLRSGLLNRVAVELHAVRGVNLCLKRGETIGVVGESGSGKTTLGRAILKLIPNSGMIRFEDRDLAPLGRDAMRPLRRSMQLVFQDPFGSLSPRMTVGAIVTEGLLVHEPALSSGERDRRAAQALEEVRLDPAARNRYAHEFSGGQRQRIAIARAMILKPRLVVLDEPTSALDRTVQKQIVDLLRDIQKANALSYLFISHDLAVVRAMSDAIMVMKDGAVVERGPAEEIVSAPRQAYTQQLMKAAFLN